MGRIGRVRPEYLASAIEGFAKVRNELGACRAGTRDAAGQQYLDFLVNRLDCTVLHLRAISTAARLQEICLKPAPQLASTAGASTGPAATAAATAAATRDASTRKVDRDPSEFTREQRKEVRAICDESLARMEQYMALHAKAMPDRGCEGTLISYYYIPPVVIRRIREP